MVTDRDREAARRALLRYAANFGYYGPAANSPRPYEELVKYVAEAIAHARSQGREEGAGTWSLK